MTDMQHNMHNPPVVESPEQRRKTIRSARNATLLALLVLLCALVHTLLLRSSNEEALAARAAENTVMHVRVTYATQSTETRLTLPGTLQASLDARINARASGYVTALYKDIGDVVRKGELLATIDIPEVKRQVDEADANYRLAKSDYERWYRLRDADAVSAQELDEKTRAYRQSEAVLKRMRAQLAFGQVVAPFSGIVTRRTVHVGELVTSDSPADGAGLFTIARTSSLHVYLYLPEHSAERVHPGDKVELVLADRHNKPITARITRSAGAIDSATHSLQVEVELENVDHALLPGSYVEASLRIPPNDNLLLPTNTLLFSAAGPEVAVVKNGTVQRQGVSLGTDFGRMVEIKRGVTEADAVIVNPSDVIVDGQAVLVEKAPVGKHG